ncbi:hypothetical protein N7512_005733 [Penicillium capsulatum]|nr:hypothetical protein N7512_005733 [Penicillium capsulatum]
MDFARTYTAPSARQLRRHFRAHRPQSRDSPWSLYHRVYSSDELSTLIDSDSDLSLRPRRRRLDTCSRYPTRQTGRQGMNWFSSLFRGDLLDLLKEKRRRREIQKEKNLAKEKERSPRLFVVDPPGHRDSPQPHRRSALKRARSVLERMEIPHRSDPETRHEPETRSRPLEAEPARTSRPLRVRTPVIEREPPRRGRRISPIRPVEVHQSNPPEAARARDGSSPEVVSVLEHATLPRTTERQTTTLRNSRTGRDQRRYLATPVPPRRIRGSLRDLPRPPVVLHRAPRSRPGEVAMELRCPDVYIEERRPRVVQDGRENLSRSGSRIVYEAQPRQPSTVRFVEPLPTRRPDSRSCSRPRRYRVADERIFPRRRD